MGEVPERSAIVDVRVTALPAQPPRPGLPRRRALRAAGALGVCVSLGGLLACGSPPPPLKVGTVLHPACELLFLARELGLLRARDIRLVELLSRADSLRLLEEGGLHACVLRLDEFMRCRADGQDLRIVCVLSVSEGADAVMARPGLTQPSHLRGMRIAVEDISQGMALLQPMLAAASLRMDEVVRVPVGAGQGVAQFRAATVDAVVATEPWVSQLEALGAQRVFDSTFVPQRFVKVLAVRSPVLQAHPEPVRQLVAAHFAALKRFEQDPSKAQELMAPRLRAYLEAFQGQDATAAQLAQGFRGHRLPSADAQLGLLRPGGGVDLAQQAVQQGLVQQRQLEQVLPLQDLLDTRFLPKV
jgi:NitT/TauT family transport system substrate-binding protein